jgi:hypothetical protein
MTATSQMGSLSAFAAMGAVDEPRQEPNISYRLLRWIYPLFRTLFPNQVIRAGDLARAMVDVVVLGTAEGPIFENRDIRTMVQSLHPPRTGRAKGRL